MLSRRLAAILAMLVALAEAVRAETAPAPDAAQAKPPPASPGPTTVEPVDKDQAVAILGRLVTGPEGKQIGRLTDVLVDGTGQPQAAVLDIGGFMGVGIAASRCTGRRCISPRRTPKAPITARSLAGPDQGDAGIQGSGQPARAGGGAGRRQARAGALIRCVTLHCRAGCAGCARWTC